MVVACSDSVDYNRVQVLSIPILLLAHNQDWTSNLQMIVTKKLKEPTLNVEWVNIKDIQPSYLFTHYSSFFPSSQKLSKK